MKFMGYSIVVKKQYSILQMRSAALRAQTLCRNLATETR